MSEDARAVIFGRDADAYDRARPDYPPEAIDHLKGLVDASDALEVGAGTGKATVEMARPGLDLTCLEPSPQMADVLAAKGLPGVTVVVSTFEDWAAKPDSVDMIFAAQAWHWVDHTTAYGRALDMLRVGGVLALMWNVPHARYETFDEVYAKHAPELLAEHDERIKKRDSFAWPDDIAAAGFVDVQRFHHEWSRTLRSEQVRALYSTYSDHMMLPEPRRGRLLDGIAAHVDRAGGSVDIEYTTNIFSGVAP